MRLSNRKTDHQSKIELSMTSMIDVVFLLLIFFMSTASFVKTERELDPAISVRRKSASQMRSDLAPAIVEVSKVSDRFVYKLGSRELTDHRDLTAILRRFENKEDGALVSVQDAAPFQMAAAAVQACKDAGFRGVSYMPASPAQ